MQTCAVVASCNGGDFASRSPSNLKPLHKYFRAPLRFDSDESALVFERHWLDDVACRGPARPATRRI